MLSQFSILYLVGAFFIIFFLLNQLIAKKRYRVQDLFNENYKEENQRRKEDQNRLSILKKSKFGRYLSADLFVKEAQKYEWNIQTKDFWVYILAGGAVLSLTISFFQLGSLSILGLGGGVVFPRFLLAIQKMRYQRLIEDKIMIYMKALSNALPVYGNTVDAMESVLPLLENPVKKDIEVALAILRSGDSAHNAFDEINKKYRYKDFVFFHNMLAASEESGGDFQQVLLTAADEFEHKRVLQAKLRAVMTQANKSFQQNVLFVFLMLLGFKFGAKDLYNQFFTTTVGKIIIGFIVLSISICALKVYRHNQFNPSEAEQK